MLCMPSACRHTTGLRRAEGPLPQGRPALVGKVAFNDTHPKDGTVTAERLMAERLANCRRSWSDGRCEGSRVCCVKRRTASWSAESEPPQAESEMTTLSRDCRTAPQLSRSADSSTPAGRLDGWTVAGRFRGGSSLPAFLGYLGAEKPEPSPAATITPMVPCDSMRRRKSASAASRTVRG
jgi:hypothetical protein